MVADAVIQDTQIGDLVVRQPFSSLFPIRDDDREAISKSIVDEGFRPHQPVLCWDAPDGLVVIDGHTRLAGAADAGIATVPVAVLAFDGEDDALLYAYRQQKERRNVTDQTLLEVFRRVDRRKTVDGRPAKETVSRDTVSSGASRDDTAAKLGIAPATVSRLRTITDYATTTGDTTIEDQVKGGEMSVTRAAVESRRLARSRTQEVIDLLDDPSVAGMSNVEIAEHVGVTEALVRQAKKKAGKAANPPAAPRTEEPGPSVAPPAPPPPTNGRKIKSVGIDLAYEAVNCLTRIPVNDPERRRGLQIVSDWIRHNK